MTPEKLTKANELIQLIEETEYALEKMEEFVKHLSSNKVSGAAYYFDRAYTLNISENFDGSGPGTYIRRYLGNEEIVFAVRDILERQLGEFKTEFSDL